MNQTNDKNLYIDIGEIINIFEKEEVKDLTKENWKSLKAFKRKITMSSSFAHKFCKVSNELESNKCKK